MVAGEGKCWSTPSLKDGTIERTQSSIELLPGVVLREVLRVLLGVVLEGVLEGVLEVFVGCY